MSNEPAVKTPPSPMAESDTPKLAESQPRGKGIEDTEAGERATQPERHVEAEQERTKDTTNEEVDAQDKTLIEEASESPTGKSVQASSSAQHTKSASKSSVSSSNAKATGRVSTYNEAWDITSWNPTKGFQPASEKGSGSAGQDETLVVEREEDVTESTVGGFLKVDGYRVPGGEEGARNDALLKPKSSPAVSRRPSALQIKPPSPQPWDLIQPPEDNMKGSASAAGRSVAASNAFARSINGRPLVPKSSYFFGPPASDAAYGTPPMGHIGVHHPREILRVERDYTGGEVIQFAPIYPLELENRLTPTQFLESINSINELLISAHSLRHAFVDNVISVMSLQLSKLFISTHFQKELKKLKSLIDELNSMLYNPVGLNILWPGDVAFLYLEIEYY